MLAPTIVCTTEHGCEGKLLGIGLQGLEEGYEETVAPQPWQVVVNGRGWKTPSLLQKIGFKTDP
jgi:hypothetical protein